MDTPVRSPSRKGHNRSKSAGVLKSIVKPASRNTSPKKRAAFAGESNGSALADKLHMFSAKKSGEASPTRNQVLGDAQNKSPSKRSLTPKKTLVLDLSTDHRDTPLSPAESSLLSSQPRDYFSSRDKENTTPPTSASPRSANVDTYAPIWAQFTSQPDKELAKLRTPGMSAKTNTKDEIEKYAPPGYGSSSPQRHTQQKDLPPPPPVGQKHPDSPSKGPNHSRQGSAPSVISTSPQKKSKVLAAVAKLQANKSGAPKESDESGLHGLELDDAFEAVLVSRNIPEHRRQNMRSLDAKIKREFIRNHKPDSSGCSDGKEAQSRGFFKSLKSSKDDQPSRGRDDTREADDVSKHQRSRSGTFSWGKRSRSNSRPRSLMSLKNLSSSSVNSVGGQAKKDDPEKTSNAGAGVTPDEFVSYLKTQQAPEKVEVGRVHKLRLLLRNETVGWVASFVELGGMSGLIDLLRKIMKVEWREEHDDLLLHEVLLCMKGLCTTETALNKLDEVSGTLFPELIDMLFDEERKGPAEFNTRGVITTLLFAHLSAASPSQRVGRAQAVLLYLSDRKPAEDERPAGFITQMQQNRPYQAWSREVSSVSKEVFWIFLHHLNVVEVSPVDIPGHNRSYFERHFPKERPPVPAAPYIGGVEWDATNYLASHLDLMNGLIASMTSPADRNSLRAELRASGLEKVMGEKLRLCKEKFYGAVHDGLRTWVAAAIEDGWETHDVRVGPSKKAESPRKENSPSKTQVPQLDLPRLDLGVGDPNGVSNDSGWL